MTTRTEQIKMDLGRAEKLARKLSAELEKLLNQRDSLRDGDPLVALIEQSFERIAELTDFSRP